MEETPPPSAHSSADSSLNSRSGMKIHEMLGSHNAGFNSKHANDKESALIASRNGDSVMIGQLLATNMDGNARDELFNLSLETAAAYDHENVIQLLLDKRASFNIASGLGRALHIAIEACRVHIVLLLLENGADANSKDDRSRTALLKAVHLGNENVVQLLLDKGADVNAVSGPYGTALHDAASGGHKNVVQLLLDKGADVNAVRGSLGTALQAAALGGHENVVQLLLDKGADVNAMSCLHEIALLAAALGGHENVVQLLLDKGADVNAVSGSLGTALHAATYGSHKEVIRLLLNRGADVNIPDSNFETAREVAARRGSEEVLQLLTHSNQHEKAQRIGSGIATKTLLPGKSYDFERVQLELGSTESDEIPIAHNRHKVDHSFSDASEPSTLQSLLPRALDHHSPQPTPALKQVLDRQMKSQSPQDQFSREERNSSDSDSSQALKGFPVLGLSRHLGFSTEGEYTSNRLHVEGLLSSPTTLALQQSEDDKSSNSGDSSASSPLVTWPEEAEEGLKAFIQISAILLVKLFIRSSQQSRNAVQYMTAGSSGDGAPAKNHRLPATETESRRGKRYSRCNDEEDEGDEDEDKRCQKKKCKSSKPADPSSTDIRPLACPFNKYDDRLFGPESPDPSYRICGSCNFVTVAHLKQHFKRNHYLPQHYCFACCGSFSSQMMLAQHQRQRPRCETREPPLHPERIGSDLIDELKLSSKNDVGTDPVDYWFRIFNRFFPGETDVREISPFYEGPYASAVFRFLRYANILYPQIRQTICMRMNVDLDDTSPGHELQLHNEVMQEAGERFLRHLEETAMPHLGKRRAEDPVGRGDSLATISGGVLMEGIQGASSESEAQDNVTSQSSSSHSANQDGTPNTSESPESTQDQLKERIDDNVMTEETIRFLENLPETSAVHDTSHDSIALCLSDLEVEPHGGGDWESLLGECIEFCQPSELLTLELGAGDDLTFPLPT